MAHTPKKQAPQKQAPPKPPRDPYAQRGKTLASSVQRLRGWIGTDASKLPELVDALDALVAHRLRGHAYAAAGPDAQEAVKRAAELLLADGPVGPYTTADAATRCGTALVQLAGVQAGLGLLEAAGRSLASWGELREQLAAAGTTPVLDPPVVVLALAGSARVALAEGDVARANAYADAAALRLERSGLRADAEAGYLPLDVDRLVADCRWAAGRTEESLTALQTAKQAHDALVDGRLADPGRYSPALVERLADPLAGLHRDLADRLGAVGELDLALVTRRTLVDLLRGLAPRLGAPAQADLVAALTDLARDLLAEGRAEEALLPAEEAVALGEEHHVPEAVRLLARAARARALGDADAAAALERQAGPGLDQARGVVSRGGSVVSWTPLEPGQAAAVDPRQGPEQRERERVEAHRRELERQEQARREAEAQAVAAAEVARAAAQRQAADQATADEARRREAERAAAAEQAEQLERRRRRQERLREHEEEVRRREREQRDARREEIRHNLDELTVAVPTAAEEHDRQRLQAELAALDAPEPEPAPVSVPQPEPEPAPAPVLEPAPEPVPEPEPEPEPDELAAAQEAYERVRADGSRRDVRAAAEALVTVLRVRAAAEPAYVDRLRSALEELASLRLRGGDLFGSRAANKEARTLARR